MSRNVIFRAHTRLDRFLQITILLFIKVYQFCISPFLGNCCRFYPSCSKYAYGVIRQFGVIKGLYLSLMRLLRCHPFNPGGYDPIPSGNLLTRKNSGNKK